MRKGLLPAVCCLMLQIAAAKTEFSVSPYLQHPSMDAMTILFFTDSACEATVEVRSAAAGGAVAEAATVRLSATGWNGATLLVSNATMVAEGCLVRAVDASATASVAIVDSVLETSYVTMPFALASGISVVIERSTYTDDMYWFSMTTALANAGADLKIGAGCVLTVANEGVIGFLADGVTAEAYGPRTWRTVKSNGDFFSFALDLDHVVDPATITEEMVKVKAVRVVDEGLLLTAWIDGVSVGRNALPENLSQIFGAVGSETPVDDFSADKAICGNMKNNGDGTVSYTVEPRVRPEGAKPGAFFFRVTVAK